MTTSNTAEGLPSGPVLDKTGNMTSAWLNAMSVVKDLNTLKNQQAALRELIGNITDLDNLLKALEVEADEMLATLRPNIATIVSLSPAGVNPLVPHNLGTEEYFGYFRQTNGTYNYAGVSLDGFGAFVLKTPDVWQHNITNGFGTLTEFMTITIEALEG